MSLAVATPPVPPKVSWADDVADLPAVANVLGERTETFDPATGIKTIVEYRTNEEGKRVKVTRQIKRTLTRTLVSHATASRRKDLAKFGLEKGKPPGPDSSTTTVGENVRLVLRQGGHKPEPAEDPMAAMKKGLAQAKITCRTCQGPHYTTRCPYKDTLGAVLGTEGAHNDDGAEKPAAATPADTKGGKYVPPSMRGDRKGAGESMNSRRDDLPTLRVTNLSEDTREADVWDIFTRFGKVTRVFIGMDQETNMCKGFAFVTFEERRDAEKAVAKVDGMPYDHLILNCGFSAPRGERKD
ncbi:translation initiation factor eIF3g [Atractiella rhizophila]|nr:translation initiation factor eIF3g [Atractiella rhizophila]